MLPAEVLDLLRQRWKARPTARNAGGAPEHRWLFPGRSDHQPLTTRQFSRLFKGPREPRDCARRSPCIRFATHLLERGHDAVTHVAYSAYVADGKLA